MDDIFNLYYLMRFVLGILGLVITVFSIQLILMYFDRLLKIRFKRDVWKKLSEEPTSIALYHGLRFLAVCLLAAGFLS